MIQFSKDYQKDIEKVYAFKQEHIFRFWDMLADEQKEKLLKQVQSIDFDLMNRLSEEIRNQDPSKVSDFKLEPADLISLEDRKHRDADALKLGEKLLADGKVAAFLVAGGQGTRLGFDGPKGIYPVTTVKKKSLFQLHAEKLIATGNKYGKQIPWFIMTSQTNHNQTVEFFGQNDFFGYQKNLIEFFIQDMIPAIDKNGKLILDAKDHIFTNPNGHGGSISALWKSGSIEKMKSVGIEYIFYFQVDNVLLRLCDPIFLGYHVSEKSEMSSKVVRKSYPEEKMGIICKINGKTGVIEYSDLSREDMYAKDSDGGIKYWAGSIAIHVFNLDFLVRENEGGFKLPYHIANKNIPFINDSGTLVTTKEKNGIKFETFVFDALLDTEKNISVEVERKLEFSPLKNNEGVDSPFTVKRDLNNLYGGWLEKSGIEIPRDKDGDVSVSVEISPLLALSETDLKGLSLNFKRMISDTYLE